MHLIFFLLLIKPPLRNGNVLPAGKDLGQRAIKPTLKPNTETTTSTVQRSSSLPRTDKRNREAEMVKAMACTEVSNQFSALDGLDTTR